MKVLGISGSPRKNSNTDILVKAVLRGAGEAGHDTEFIKLNDIDMQACQACDYCRESSERRCKLEDEGSSVLDRTMDCDVLVFGSPVYMAGLSAQAKAYIDRWYSFKDSNRITKIKGNKKVIGIYAQGAKDGTYHRLFETNERLFNSNNFEYLGTLVSTEYRVPEEGSDLFEKAYQAGIAL